MDDNFCYICMNTNTYNLIKSFCHCKNTHIHIDCLVQMIKKTKKTYCSVCKETFNAYYDYRHRIIFPFENIYCIPLLTNQYVKLDTKDYSWNIEYALINRIDNKIKLILEEMNDNDYIEYKDKLKIIGKNPDWLYNCVVKDLNDKIYINLKNWSSYFTKDTDAELDKYVKYIENLFDEREKRIN